MSSCQNVYKSSLHTCHRHLLSACAALGIALVCTAPLRAEVFYSEDFSTAPDGLSSGNWNSFIADGVVPVPGTWSTSGGIATATNSGAGIVQANAQYIFDSTQLENFGALYDANTGMIGGGSVSGSLYYRFNTQILHPNPANLGPNFAGVQLYRGDAQGNRGVLDQYAGNGPLAVSLGKNWGNWAYSYWVNGVNGQAEGYGDLNAIGAPDPQPYRDVDTEWHTIVARIDYSADAPDALTVWFDPDFNLSEAEQDPALTIAVPTSSTGGNYAFNTFVLRAGNNDMTASFDDLIFGSTAADVGFSAVPPSQPGDFDGDGDVDGADFVVWQTNFPTAEGATLGQGNADGDGDVDGADFSIWQSAFPHPAAGSVTPVPEPHGIVLGLFAVTCLTTRARSMRLLRRIACRSV